MLLQMVKSYRLILNIGLNSAVFIMSSNQFSFDDPRAPKAKAKSNVLEFSVTELSTAIRRVVEDGFSHVRLRGEVSGFRGPHGSGHSYFSIKDSKAKIDAIIWKGVWGKLKIKPEEGMEVIVTGRVTTFPGKSGYQIVIEQLEAAGIGALLAQLEERKKRLEKEGLFDETRKKPIPFLPKVVGIITSPTGAVIRDMLHGFEERFPVHVLVWPVRVQGENSGKEVANGVKGFNALVAGGEIPRPDILIVARGGGSLEDLWGFNDEVLVRAVAESDIPVISAVGHETDWTLVDYAADARAPTPTKAAEWAVPKHSELLQKNRDYSQRLNIAIKRNLEHKRTRFLAAKRGLPNLQDIIGLARQRLDASSARLGAALQLSTSSHRATLSRLAGRLSPRLIGVRNDKNRQMLTDISRRINGVLSVLIGKKRALLDQNIRGLSPRLAKQKIEICQKRLEMNAKFLHSLSHHASLARGFAMVTDAQGKLVRTAKQLSQGAQVALEFSDGKKQALITEDGIAASPISAPKQAVKKAVKKRTVKPKKAAKDDGQGSLF